MQYAIVRRDFALLELMLLVDAVESCKFLVICQPKTLATKLKLSASDHERALLDRRIRVSGRITSKTGSVFGSINALHNAMRRKQKVEFMCCKYELDGRWFTTHDDKSHLVSPAGIAFADGYYYLTAWNDDYECMTEYCIDCAEKLRAFDERATKNEPVTHYEFEGEECERFGRFGGEAVTVTLLANGDEAEIIADRFGDAAEWYKHDDDTTKIVVKTRKSEPFFGWIAELGGAVHIHGPKSRKKESSHYVRSLIESDES